MIRKTERLPDDDPSLVAVLEAIGSVRPGVLEFIVRRMLAGPARGALLEMAERWGIEVDRLADTVVVGLHVLDACEEGVLRSAEVPTAALLELAWARMARFDKRQPRLERMARELGSTLRDELHRKRIEAFLQGDD